MADPASPTDQSWARLRQRAALNVVLDECAIVALSDAVAVHCAACAPATPDLEHAIRAHRIDILKQRAVLAVAGIDA